MNRLRDALILLPFAAYYLFLAYINPQVAPDIPLFIGFVAAFIMLPAIGYGALALRHGQGASPLERLFLGSPVAIAVLVCLAYAQAATRISWLIWLTPCAGLAALAVSALPQRAPARPEGGQVAPRCPAMKWADIWLIIVPLAAALSLAAIKATWCSPAQGGAVSYHMDDIWMGGYIFSALRALNDGLPLQHFALVGYPVGYHLFYHYTYAVCTQLTGLHPMDMVLFLVPAVFLFLTTGALVVGCKRLANFSTLETSLAIVFIIFGAGYTVFASHTVQIFYFFHTYGFGLPYFLLFTAMMYGYLSGRVKSFNPLYGAICFFTMCGSKGDLAILVPIALFPVLLYRIFQRQLCLRDVGLALGCLASLVPLKLMLYMDTSRASIEHAPKIMKLLTGTAGGLKDMIVVVGLYLGIMLFAADANPVIRAKLARNKQYLVFAGAFMLAACVALKLYNFIGGDQYFFWHAKIIVLFAFVPVAAYILTWRIRGYRIAVFALMLFALGFTIPYLYLAESMFKQHSQPEPQYNSELSQDERDCLLWAYHNIPHDSVFFCNRDHYLVPYLGTFIVHEFSGYIALSGLQGYAWQTSDLVGDELKIAHGRREDQQAFFSAKTPQEAADALGKIKAAYYFHSTSLAPVVVPPGLTEVHRTASLIIYRNTYAHF